MPRVIRAFIGVRKVGARTWYVRRSEKMENYPGVLSLPSIQFEEGDIVDPRELQDAQYIAERLSAERFMGVPIKVMGHLISGKGSNNPMGALVILHLYEISLGLHEHASSIAGEGSQLNPDYYSESEWLTPEQYEERSAGDVCGLCLRLYSKWYMREGLIDRPFAPEP